MVANEEEPIPEDDSSSEGSNFSMESVGPKFMPYGYGEDDLYDDTDPDSTSEPESESNHVELDNGDTTMLNVESILENIKKMRGLDQSESQSRLQRAVIGEKSIKASNDRLVYRKSTMSSEETGKLTRLLEAPLDIFVEIACYLEPLDLLHLARVSRPLRGLLMSPQSRTIWKASRNAMGMPDCPGDLAEPVYAHLVFETHCSVCGNQPVDNATNFVLRLRLCDECIEANMVQSSVVKDIDAKLAKDKIIYKLVPKQIVYDSWGLPESYFFKPDLLDAIANYVAAMSDPTKCKDFVDLQQRRRGELIKEGCAIEKWAKKYFEGIYSSRYKIMMQRHASIIKKLQEKGWPADDIQAIKRSSRFKKGANQPCDLTEDDWEAIFPTLESHLPKMKRLIEKERRIKEEEERERQEQLKKWQRENEIKLAEKEKRKAQQEINRKKNLEKKETKAREEKSLAIFGRIMSVEELNSSLSVLNVLKVELSENYKQYVTAQPKTALSIFPNIADVLVALPEPLNSSVYSRNITGASLWDAIVPHLPAIFTAYTNKLQSRCLQIFLSTRGQLKLPQKKEFKSVGKDPAKVLFLAWAFFKCASMKCASLPSERYPTVLNQEHNDAMWSEADPRPMPACSHMVRDLTCPVAMMHAACMLLESLKLPLTTRMSELSDMGRVFVCLRCRASSDDKMTWESLVRHFSGKAVEVLKSKQDFYSTSNDHFVNLSSPLASKVL